MYNLISHPIGVPMKNFNFIFHPEQRQIINLHAVISFYKDNYKNNSHYEYSIWFDFEQAEARSWYWGEVGYRDEVFNALLKLTGQNLCSAASPWNDPPQTDRSMLMRNTEKHQLHPLTNPF